MNNEPVPHSDLKRGKTYLADKRQENQAFDMALCKYVKIISKRHLDIRYESSNCFNEVAWHWKLYEIGSDFEKQYAIKLQNLQLKEHIISLVNETEITESNKDYFNLICKALLNLKSDANSQL